LSEVVPKTEPAAKLHINDG